MNYGSGSDESFMSKLRDPKKFRIYFQTILNKQSVTITKKIFNNFASGFYELNKIFKDYLNMKFVMKMKSEMDQEKIEEEKIFGRDDYRSPKDKLIGGNNLNTPKGNILKNEIYNKAQPKKNFNSNRDSKRDSENSLQNVTRDNDFNNFKNLKNFSNNQIYLNKFMDNPLIDKNVKNKHMRTISDYPSASQSDVINIPPEKVPFNITKKISYPQEENIPNKNNLNEKRNLGNDKGKEQTYPNLNLNSFNNNNNNIKTLDSSFKTSLTKQSPQSENSNKNNPQLNSKLNHNDNNYNDKAENTNATIKTTENTEYQPGNRNTNNQNYNNTPINLKSKILDQIARPTDFLFGKKENETIQSTSVTRTENSEYDLNNSRRTDYSKNLNINNNNNNNDINNLNNLNNISNLSNISKNKNEKGDKNDSKSLKDILTDDLTDFPEIRLHSQKIENFPCNSDNKNMKKDHKNEIKLMEVNNHPSSQKEMDDKVTIKKNDSKNLGQATQNFNFVPYDRKTKKHPENKPNKTTENLKNNSDKNFSVFTLIETPNYGTVSFIAQRFEKIELDQWRDD
jgi:hypothetical protein